jgi:hypothetical protein
VRSQGASDLPVSYQRVRGGKGPGSIKSDAGHRAEAKALNPAVLLVVSPNCLPGDQIGKDCQSSQLSSVTRRQNGIVTMHSILNQMFLDLSYLPLF